MLWLGGGISLGTLHIFQLSILKPENPCSIHGPFIKQLLILKKPIYQIFVMIIVLKLCFSINHKEIASLFMTNSCYLSQIIS